MPFKTESQKHTSSYLPCSVCCQKQVANYGPISRGEEGISPHLSKKYHSLLGCNLNSESLELSDPFSQEIDFDGLPQWIRGEESAFNCRRHGFYPWSWRISHAQEQLSSCTTSTEPGLQILGAAHPRTCALKLHSSPHSPQLEKIPHRSKKERKGGRKGKQKQGLLKKERN